MRQWLTVVLGLMCWAIPVSAQHVYIIAGADSTGPTIMTPAEFQLEFGKTARLDSVLSSWQALIATLPYEPARDDYFSLTWSENLTVVIALQEYWDANMPFFTNIDPSEPRCPRMFINGLYLLNPAVSACQKRGLLVHEWKHARDFIDGRMPACYNDQLPPVTPADKASVFAVERGAFQLQIQAMMAGDCLHEDAFGRAFQVGGEPGLDEEILDVYNLHEAMAAYRESHPRLLWPRPWQPNNNTPQR